MRPASVTVICVAVLVALGLVSPVVAGDLDVDPDAGQLEPREGRALGVGVSLGGGSMSVGGESDYNFVAGLVARVGLDSRNRYQLIAEFHPMKVDSPIIDESFTSLNVMAGFTFGQTVKIRPSIGAQFRWWSGSQKVEPSDTGLLVGLDLGPELRLSDTVSVSPEFVLRYSVVEVEGSVSSSFVGVQCVVSWRRGSS
jgi:hypothetical protein